MKFTGSFQGCIHRNVKVSFLQLDTTSLAMQKIALIPSPKHFKILAVLPPVLIVLFYVAFAVLAMSSVFQGSSPASGILVWFGGFYLMFSLVLLPLYLLVVSCIFFVRKEHRLLSIFVFSLNLFWLFLVAIGMSPTAQSV